MNDASPDQQPDALSMSSDAQTLYLFGSEFVDGYHLVSKATVDRANAEHDVVTNAPYYENYGELRRSDDLDQLSERLGDHDVSLEEYAASIERAAGKAAHPGTLTDRFAALESVDFDGDDDDNTPSDSTDFRSESELDNEVEDDHVFVHVIAISMDDDVPADLLAEFCSHSAPMFVDYTIVYVTEDRLEPLIAALEARGHAIVRDP